MRVRKRRDHVPQCVYDIGYRKFALTREPRSQGLTSHVGHDEVGKPLGFAGRQQQHDVGVLKLRGKLDLASESLDIDPGGELRKEHLHYDLTAERSLMCYEHP